MDILTIDDVPGGSAGARLPSGRILHFGRAARPGTVETWLPATVTGLLAAGTEGLDIARRMVDRAQQPGQAEELEARGALLAMDTRLLAPVPNPRLVLALGLNYRSHLKEMSGTPVPPHPTAFMKSPNSVIGPGAPLPIPPQARDMVDYEGEAALVFGRSCYRVTEADAMSCIAGITAANDISARDWTPAVFGASTPWEARLTWEVNIMGKQLPGFTALGPVLRTLDAVGDLSSLGLTTRVNGKTRQHDILGGMLFTPAQVIAYFSQWYRFEPGDVLLTGTPAGVGLARRPQAFLKPGDTVEVELNGIGVLYTPVVKGANQ